MLFREIISDYGNHANFCKIACGYAEIRGCAAQNIAEAPQGTVDDEDRARLDAQPPQTLDNSTFHQHEPSPTVFSLGAMPPQTYCNDSSHTGKEQSHGRQKSEDPSPGTRGHCSAGLGSQRQRRRHGRAAGPPDFSPACLDFERGIRRYGYLLTDTLATKLAEGGGLGLAKILQKQLTPHGAASAATVPSTPASP